MWCDGTYCPRYLTWCHVIWCEVIQWDGMLCGWLWGHVICCAFGPTLAASTKLMCKSTQTYKKQAEQHSFWTWGNGCDTSHSRAFTRGWLVGTWNLWDNEELRNGNECPSSWLRTLVLSGHLPTTWNTLVLHLGWERRRNEWVGKEKILQRGGSKWQHPKDATYLKHASPDNACPLYCCVTWPARAEKCTWENFWQLAAVFVWLQKLTTAFLQIVYHVHETTIVLLGLRQLPVQNSCANQLKHPKRRHGCDTSHSCAFSPA